MYSLNLDKETGRVLSACVGLPYGNYEGMPIVEELPDGNLPDCLYIDGQYIYDPLPEQPEPVEEPSVWDELDAAYREGVDSV